VFNSPLEGDEVSGPTTIDITVGGSTRGKQIKEVIFEINDGEIGRDDRQPYSLEYDFNQLTVGDVTLEAIVMATDDTEIVSNRIQITIVEGEDAAAAGEEEEPEATVTPFLRPSATPESFISKLTSSGDNTMLIIGGAAILLVGFLVIIGIIVIVVMKRKSSESAGPPPSMESTAPPTFESDKTMDGFSFGTPPAHGAAPGGFGGGMLGMLRILASEDQSMAGQVFNITKPRTTIGRGADNDLVLPRDKAVSRHHAMIEATGSSLFLSEVVSQDAGRI